MLLYDCSRCPGGLYEYLSARGEEWEYVTLWFWLSYSLALNRVLTCWRTCGRGTADTANLLLLTTRSQISHVGTPVTEVQGTSYGTWATRSLDTEPLHPEFDYHVCDKCCFVNIRSTSRPSHPQEFLSMYPRELLAGCGEVLGGCQSKWLDRLSAVLVSRSARCWRGGRGGGSAGRRDGWRRRRFYERFRWRWCSAKCRHGHWGWAKPQPDDQSWAISIGSFWIWGWLILTPWVGFHSKRC